MNSRMNVWDALRDLGQFHFAPRASWLPALFIAVHTLRLWSLRPREYGTTLRWYWCRPACLSSPIIFAAVFGEPRLLNG